MKTKKQLKEELRLEQQDLYVDCYFIADVNITTCGNCGGIILQKANKEGNVTCPHCLTEMEQSDTPDLFYNN